MLHSKDGGVRRAMRRNAASNGELTNEAAEVEPVVDALVKSHAEFEVRKDRYKKALAK